MHPTQKRNKENPQYRSKVGTSDELIDVSKAGTSDELIDVYADPHYGKKCVVCGQRPCVQFRRLDNDKIAYATDMCGPCTFGEAACIDPTEW
jgi:hypothetical protein